MNLGLGELFSLLSALAWAIGVILYRQLGAALPPMQLNFLKNALVLGMLLPALPLVHGAGVPDLPASHVWLALASGAIGIGIADTLYFRALNALGAGRMGVLGNLYSPFVIALGYAFLGERLAPVQLAGFAVVSIGVALAAWPRRGADGRPVHALRGLAYAVASIALMAVAVVMIKRVLEAQPLLWVTAIRMVGALAVMAGLAALTGQARPLWPARGTVPWRRLALAAFVGQCLAMVLWLAGYKFTQASVAAILNETASVFILVLAALWLKEPLTRRGVAGVVLTMAGVALLLAHPG